MKRFLWAVFLSCLLCTGGAAGSAAATPAVALSDKTPRIEIASHAEYYLDPSGTLRYEEVLTGKVPFRSHTGPSFQFSFRNAVLWIQCRLARPPGAGEELRSRESLLVFDNATLGSLTLYVPVLNQGVPETAVLKGGWQAGRDSSEVAFLYPTFLMPEGLDGTRPLVIRVETPFALQFRVTHYTLAAFKDTSARLFLVIGFCAGILVAMLLYNLVLYTFVRERQYLWYILYVLFLLLWQCTLFGIVRYFWPGPGEWMVAHIPAISSLMALFAVVFAIAFLETSRRTPRHHRLLQVLAFCSAAIVVLVLLRYQWIGNVAAYLAGQVGTVALFTAALASLRSGFKPARYYLIAVTLFLAASLIFLFRFYGWVPNNTFTMQALLFGAAAEAILLSFALGYRIRIIEEEGLILREREKSLTEMVVTDELTGLFNRRFFSAALAKRIADSSRTGEPLALLVMDVDHFKRYNDTYGHSDGDVILKRLGEVVLMGLREGDIACRYGGEEFVVILNHANLERAAQVAERIRTRFEKEVFEPRKGVRVPVSMSIGVGEWRPGESGDDLFIRCDSAMYRAKETGRNRACLA